MISLVSTSTSSWNNGKYMIHRHGRPLGIVADICFFEDLIAVGLAKPGDWSTLEAIIRAELQQVSPFDAVYAPDIVKHLLDNLLPKSLQRYR